MSKYEALLQEKLGDTFLKLDALKNEKLNDFLGEYIELCNPDSVYFCDDSDADAEYIRKRSLELGEEKQLARKNVTMHYDGINDQARDKGNTKYMVPAEKLAAMGKLNCIETNEAQAEVRSIMKDMMVGKKAIVKLFCECPTHSPFSIACAQLTDSCYVAHSEDILYRRGYQHFMDMKDKDDFFRFCHSAGQLDENGCCVNLDKRRIYQDLDNNMVFSMNAQYAGNTVGLKKHSMRLAINKSGQEGWLCEHMFIMSVPNEKKARSTYFVGAFPSACGKTATAMIPGEKIVGDDIAYFKNIDGEFRAANVERGIFGIIKDVNPDDDPVIFRTLQESKEMIFSNVLTGPDNLPYWLGMGVETPAEGVNFAGAWKEGGDTPISHGNARYTMRMEYLENLDPAWDDKEGVKVQGVLYGGRDSDTTVPCEESCGWEDGIILKACPLESETTAATIGQEGVRVPQPMANLDFITYPIGDYVKNNIDFGNQFGDKCPKVFSTNYFLRTPEGEFCTSKLAKKVWLHWFEGRVYGEYEAYETPTGFIPKYEDLKVLFKEQLGDDYCEADYTYQFSFRCDAWIAKLQRAKKFFSEMAPTLPQSVYDYWDKKIAEFEAVKAKYGAEVKPGEYKGI
ncbi:phosphoenolpyruvate carboxykinase (GTP) [Lentisphaerota bacterium ZTH]|nr:phosphoenolpyruvate carboxykinase (GTP) [Lentisphaerota bacterium]WET05390.1 phosphoenolpyruvate carboxykinase (GTP) [Lentisphaerota bacterium ZTH]